MCAILDLENIKTTISRILMPHKCVHFYIILSGTSNSYSYAGRLLFVGLLLTLLDLVESAALLPFRESGNMKLLVYDAKPLPD
jgi:hypothetical protein